MNALRPAIFLDRDGVLIKSMVRDGKPRAARTLAECRLLPRVPEALSALKAAGFSLIVTTNQPDVATGEIAREAVDNIHEFLRKSLPLDAIKMCCHVDADRCDCRKPKPAMLISAAAELAVDLRRSFMVGDRWRDICAGHVAGCTTILVGDGYGEEFPVTPDHWASDLMQAAKIALNERAGKESQ
jgi:D-glycero-D-manno-heptose 1,7-bisphosphate phosphatase